MESKTQPGLTAAFAARQSRGFVVIGSIPLILAILVMALGVSLATGFQQLKIIPLQICRSRHLDLQNNAETTAENLLQLNPKVKALRGARQVAEAAVTAAAISGNPIAIAAAADALETIITSQEALYILQQGLLKNYWLQSHLQKSQIASEIRAQLGKKFSLWSFLLKFDGPQVQTSVQDELPMTPDIETALPAIYTRDEDFTDVLTSDSHWQYSVAVQSSWQALRQQWQAPIRWQDHCKASVFEKEGSWHANLYTN